MPEDIANVALFLAGDESRALTGQIIESDLDPCCNIFKCTQKIFVWARPHDCKSLAIIRQRYKRVMVWAQICAPQT